MESIAAKFIEICKERQLIGIAIALDSDNAPTILAHNVTAGSASAVRHLLTHAVKG